MVYYVYILSSFTEINYVNPKLRSLFKKYYGIIEKRDFYKGVSFGWYIPIKKFNGHAIYSINNNESFKYIYSTSNQLDYHNCKFEYNLCMTCILKIY